MFLLLTSIVYSMVPFIQEATGEHTIEIRNPTISTIKQNQEGVVVHSHIFNRTTGLFMTNETTDCFINLYNSIGEHSLKEQMTYEPGEHGGEFELSIGSGNFSTIGEHGFIIQCNSSSQGGFSSGSFDVTITGTQPTTAQGFLYSILMFISFLVLVIQVYFIFNVDCSQFTTHEVTGEIIGVNWKKYYKNALIIMAYATAVWVTSLGRTIAENFLFSTGLAKFFYVFFIIMISLGLPLLTVYVIMFFVSFITDKKNQKLFDRGLKP